MKFRLVAATVVFAACNLAHAATGDPAKAQPIVKQVCANCHGIDGNSTVPTFPKLAGQHAAYVFKQLMDFKDHKRVNPIMAGMVATLSKDDMENLAAYFSEQKPAPGVAHDPELAKLGQTIYRAGIASKHVPACAGCHSPDGAGIPNEFPRIGGQHSVYIVEQLKAFRSGQRANDPNAMMRTIASRLSDKEIDALADYIQGLR